jgi:mono/diheme cytochrome c family protein
MIASLRPGSGPAGGRQTAAGMPLRSGGLARHVASHARAGRAGLPGRALRAVLSVLALTAFTWGGAAHAQAGADAAQIKRGEYLARAADCIACHTVKGGRPYAGGLPFKLPFGTLYAPNITADKETGIGTWSDDDFVRAMHEGVGKDGKHFYPAFPYTSYTLVSRDDALAIKAYLFSLPTVRQPNREADLSFPYNQRWAMTFWNLLFNPNKRFEPDAARSAEWNRGAYLVEGLGHCGECHTPRNFLQARKSSENLAGARIQGWKAYNITSNAAHGVGGWSDAALASYLSTGHGDGHGSAGGPMAEAVNNSLRYLTPQDIRAMVTYLKSVPAQSSDLALPVVRKTLTASPDLAPGDATANRLGEKTFAAACASCHRWDGSGTQTSYAELLGAQSVNDAEATNLVLSVLNGGSLSTPHGEMSMPAFGGGYSDAEIAALANYVTGRFGAHASALSAKDVAARRAPE